MFFFFFYKKPNSLSSCLGVNTPASYDYYTNCNSSFLVSVNLRQCTLGDGSTCTATDMTNLMAPTVDATNVCRNLVKSVTYLLQYQNPGGVIKASLDVEFFNDATSSTAPFSSTSNPVGQAFQVVYVPSTDSIVRALFNFNNLSRVARSLKMRPGERKEGI